MDPLRQDQEDIAARLAGDGYFADISVFEQRRGVTENDIERALSTITEKASKSGAAVIVLKPRLQPSEPDAPGPEYRILIEVQVITQPLVNDGDAGTQKETEAIAERVRLLLHRFGTTNGTFSFAGMEAADVEEGKDAFIVGFTRLARYGCATQCGLPLLAPDEGSGTAEVTITSGTDGASIYYTLDGTYPRAGNGTLYAAPFAPGAGVTLRAVAYKDGLLPSNVTGVTFT
jgi:hypothetical protein